MDSTQVGRRLDTAMESFRIGTGPVSQGLYATVMKDHPLFDDSCCRGFGVESAASLTFHEAILFCNAYSKRLGLDTAYSYSRLHFPEEGNTLRWSLLDLEAIEGRNGFKLPTALHLAMAGESGRIRDTSWRWAP